MIGNDIVDLAKAKQESGIFRPRYLEKICSTEEINLILSAAEPIRCFWRIWTMKESAYKAVQRQFNLKPAFNPFAFACLFQDSEFGTVDFRVHQLSTKTIKTDDYVYSEIIDNEIKQQFFGASSDILLMLKNELNLQSLPEFSKTKQGLPILNLADKTLSVSKTHHGRFQAFQY